MICIHHKDLDGFCAAAVVKAAHPDVILLPYTYGEPVVEFDQGEELVMVDVSFPLPDMVRLMATHKFTWIDHHQQAIDEVNLALENVLLPEYNGYLRSGTAACELAWEYFFKERPKPILVELIGQYDVFNIKGKYNWEGLVIPVQLALQAKVNGPDDILRQLYITNTEALVNAGEAIFQWNKRIVDRIMDKSFTARFVNGNLALCVNSPFSDSDQYTNYATQDHDFGLSFVFDAANNFWRVSIRALKPDFDAAAFAAGFGGGGHKGAAGFQVEYITDLFPQHVRAPYHEIFIKNAIVDGWIPLPDEAIKNPKAIKNYVKRGIIRAKNESGTENIPN